MRMIKLLVLALALLTNAFNLEVKMGSIEQQMASSNPIVIRVTTEQGRVKYVVDSKPSSDPLRALQKLVETKGENWPVIALFTWDASFKDVYDLEIVASKAGFKTIRAFVVRNGFMSEIKFEHGIPFSTNPPL